MYFLVKAVQLGLNVVYESVEQRKTYVFSPTNSRIIEKKIEIADVPELKSTNTLHLFDAKTGKDAYGITRVVGGAYQILFSSTNLDIYRQFIRNSDVFPVIFPSTTEEEFNFYAKELGVKQEAIEQAVKISAYGRIRPLTSLSVHYGRMKKAIQNFDLENLSKSAEPENISAEVNPAILMDASLVKDLSDDETDVLKIADNYFFYEARWNFCSDFVVQNVLNKYGSEGDLIVERLYIALENSFDSSVGPFIGKLFEWVAVRPAFIPNHGLVCESMDKKPQDPSTQDSSTWNSFIIGKGNTVQDCPVDNDISSIIKNYNDKNVIYNFGKNQNAFDCFIPPNNFIGFTTTLQDGKGNHPILLKTALDLCKELEKNKLPVNFITAVPFHQKDKWKKEQSFKISKALDQNEYSAISNALGKKDKEFQLVKEKLPDSIQRKLKNFRQFVGTLIIKRNFHSVPFRCKKFSLSCFSFFSHLVSTVWRWLK